jgi:hypothetical protein
MDYFGTSRLVQRWQGCACHSLEPIPMDLFPSCVDSVPKVFRAAADSRRNPNRPRNRKLRRDRNLYFCSGALIVATVA